MPSAAPPRPLRVPGRTCFCSIIGSLLFALCPPDGQDLPELREVLDNIIPVDLQINLSRRRGERRVVETRKTTHVSRHARSVPQKTKRARIAGGWVGWLAR